MLLRNGVRPCRAYWLEHKPGLRELAILDPVNLHSSPSALLAGSQISVAPNTYVYAQCLEGGRGGVPLLVINADQQRSFDLNLPTAGERYTLTAKQLEDTKVELNGTGRGRAPA